jgi:hypothetical protein
MLPPPSLRPGGPRHPLHSPAHACFTERNRVIPVLQVSSGNMVEAFYLADRLPKRMSIQNLSRVQYTAQVLC